MYHGGDPDCLPGAFISNQLVKILNTIASASLLFAMGLASDIEMMKQNFKVLFQTELFDGFPWTVYSKRVLLGTWSSILWSISSIPHHARLCNHIYQETHLKIQILFIWYWQYRFVQIIQSAEGPSNELHRSFGNIYVWNFTRWGIVKFRRHVYWIKSRALC